MLYVRFHDVGENFFKKAVIIFFVAVYRYCARRMRIVDVISKVIFTLYRRLHVYPSYGNNYFSYYKVSCLTIYLILDCGGNGGGVRSEPQIIILLSFSVNHPV